MRQPRPTVRVRVARLLIASAALAPLVWFDRVALSQSTAPTTRAPSETQPDPVAPLASRVPGDVMLFLEMPRLPALMKPASGPALPGALMGVFRLGAATTAPGGTQPNGDGLQQLFAAAVGLDDRKAIDLLFSGPMAIAADGWSGLSDAVLVAWPGDPAALERELAGKRMVVPGETRIRRYALERGHQLACDGKTVILGRMSKRTGLFARTLDLLSVGGKPALAEQPEFRERTASLPRDSQMVVYVGKAAASVSAQDPLTAWWPDDWPRLKTIALGLMLDTQGLTVRVSGRLDAEGPQIAHTEPPVQIMRRLPHSVIATWTHAVDYVGGYRRLRARFADDPEGFRFDALEAGLESGAIEKRLLNHLVGDTVLAIDQVTVKPLEAAADSEQLILPTAAFMAETDDPDAVAATIAQVAANLVAVVNQQTPAHAPIALKTESLAPGGPVMYSVPVGRVLGAKSRCDLLHSLELTAAVADRWLVVGTHPQTVRRMIEARRGTIPSLPIQDLDRIIENVAARGGQPRRVLVAQPRVLGVMIGSWILHVTQHHPEMLASQWWVKLLRHQRAMGKQMGILARASAGMVEVVDVLPDGPARDRLLAGDRILAVDGIKLEPGDPLKSLREYIAERRNPEQALLLVMRADKQQEVVLPLPGDAVEDSLGSPVELLKRVANLSRLFGSASYVLWQSKPDVIDARVDLRYAAPRAPVSSTVPATQAASSRPASQPASQPASSPTSTPASQPATAPR